MERQFVESMVWVPCQEIGSEKERRETEVGELSCYSRTCSHGAAKFVHFFDTGSKINFSKKDITADCTLNRTFFLYLHSL